MRARTRVGASRGLSTLPLQEPPANPTDTWTRSSSSAQDPSSGTGDVAPFTPTQDPGGRRQTADGRKPTGGRKAAPLHQVAEKSNDVGPRSIAEVEFLEAVAELVAGYAQKLGGSGLIVSPVAAMALVTRLAFHLLQEERWGPLQCLQPHSIAELAGSIPSSLRTNPSLARSQGDFSRIMARSTTFRSSRTFPGQE